MTLSPKDLYQVWLAIAMLIAPMAIFIRIVSRSSCFFRHRDKKYVACELVGRYMGREQIPVRCSCTYANHKYKARWVCEGCGKMGEHCVVGWGDWTVLQGQLVPDVKKLANWGVDK